jgi:hypothetical protein
MQVELKDFVIGRIEAEGKKPVTKLLRITHSDGAVVTGLDQKLPHIKKETFRLPSHNIVCNLGKNPEVGSVLGHSTSRCYKGLKADLGNLGEAYLFYKASKEELDTILKTSQIVSDKLEEYGLGFLVADSSSLVFELAQKCGKYSGLYYTEKKDVPARIVMSLNAAGLEVASTAKYEYIILHELAHHLDFKFVSQSQKARAAWVNLFKTSVSADKVKAEECVDLLGLISETETTSVKDFAGELEVDSVATLKKVIGWIKKNRRLDVQDINSFLREHDKEALAEIWPRSSIYFGNPHPIISEYACKNSRELFAEAFAFQLSGMKIPKDVASLLDKSISYAIKASKNNGDVS